MHLHLFALVFCPPTSISLAAILASRGTSLQAHFSQPANRASEPRCAWLSIVTGRSSKPRSRMNSWVSMPLFACAHCYHRAALSLLMSLCVMMRRFDVAFTRRSGLHRCIRYGKRALFHGTVVSSSSTLGLFYLPCHSVCSRERRYSGIPRTCRLSRPHSIAVAEVCCCPMLTRSAV